MTTNEIAQARTATIAYIRKQLRTRAAKTANWPGAPVSHFSCIGDEAEALRALLADGSVVLVERPKPSGFTAAFICIP